MPDAVVIGGGHNGLTAALLLVNRGYSVELFEASDRLGGACTTRRIECGCRVNEAANAFGMVPDHILEELGLGDFGNNVVMPDPQIVVIAGQRNTVALHLSPTRTLERLPEALASDALALADFLEDLGLAGKILQPFLLNGTTSLADVFLAMEDSKQGLGTCFLTGSLRSALDSYFKTDLMKAVCAASAPLYPCLTCEAGSAFVLTYASQSSNRGVGGWGIVKGGIGQFTEQLSERLTKGGCRVHLRSPVQQIKIDSGVITGVQVASSHVEAGVVIAAINPLLTLTRLFKPGELHPELLEAAQLKRRQGGCAKLNLLLDKPMDHWLARWPSLQDQHTALFVYCPSLAFLDRAFKDFLSGHPSSHPYLEITFQGDPAHEMTCGEHTPVSIFVLYVPHPESRHESISRATIEQVIRAQLETLFPSFNEHVLWSSMLLPEDIEANYGMLLGNVDHGSMTPDNLFENRPVPRNLWSSRRPRGLVLGNAGRHPGGLVSAVPGYLAYHEAVQELNDCR